MGQLAMADSLRKHVNNQIGIWLKGATTGWGQCAIRCLNNQISITVIVHRLYIGLVKVTKGEMFIMSSAKPFIKLKTNEFCLYKTLSFGVFFGDFSCAFLFIFILYIHFYSYIFYTF